MNSLLLTDTKYRISQPHAQHSSK